MFLPGPCLEQEGGQARPGTRCLTNPNFLPLTKNMLILREQLTEMFFFFFLSKTKKNCTKADHFCDMQESDAGLGTNALASVSVHNLPGDKNIFLCQSNSQEILFSHLTTFQRPNYSNELSRNIVCFHIT